MIDKQQIIIGYFRQGKSGRQLAKELNISRNTVMKYIKEYEELIEIKTLTNYSGGIPKSQRKKVMKWAKPNQAYLLEKWDEYNSNN